MVHTFDTNIAKKYGVHCAIILNHLYFWIEKNKANGKNFFDGYYWTYNTKNSFSELFPYLTQRQIDYSLRKLIDEKIIITGNYNKSSYNRTLWYAITNFGYSILQNCKMEDTNLVNGSDKIVDCINTDINKDINTTDIKTDIRSIIDYLNSKLNSKYKYSSEATVKHINARLNEGFTVDDFKIVIDKKYAEWKGTEREQYLRPQTLFGTKFESYLNQTGGRKQWSK